MLADRTYFSFLDMDTKSEEIQPIKFKQMSTGLFLSDDNFIYSLCQKIPETGTSSGFRLFDIENCIR